MVKRMGKKMREILFRAKRKDNGIWVYWDSLGRLIRDINTTEYQYYGCVAVLLQNNEIDLDTISQYTGVKDKKYNKIWENDIVKDREYYSPIHYKNGYFEAPELGLSLQFLVSGINNYIEVVGNKFDNPELLEIQ